MSRKTKGILAALAMVIVATAPAFFLSGCSGKGPQIKTATVAETNLGVTVSASGKVTAGLRADVYPPVPGTLTDVYVTDGQAVKAGQKLAQLDTAPLELQVQQAKAGVSQAQSQLALINLNSSSQADLNAAKASVTAAEAQYSAASAAYDAAVDAYELAKNPPPPMPSNPASVAVAVLNQKQAYAAKKQAYAGLLNAKAGQNKAKRGTNVWSPPSAAQAAVRSAQAAYSVALANLNNATLVAPISGTVFLNPTGAPGADGKTPLPASGSAVAPQAAPFSVADLGASIFTAEVDEADVDRLKVGMAASVTLDSFPGQTFKSSVTRINPASQPTATGGTIFPVDIALTDTGKNILIGMKGDTTIEVSSIKSALTIPVEALFNENGKNFVYKVDANKLVKTDITVGATTDTEVEVLQGLAKGDVVALSGATQYTDGMTVRVQNK